MDKYRIDSHKLMYHINRVNDWLKGKLIYPERIFPSGIFIKIALRKFGRLKSAIILCIGQQES